MFSVWPGDEQWTLVWVREIVAKIALGFGSTWPQSFYCMVMHGHVTDWFYHVLPKLICNETSESIGISNWESWRQVTNCKVSCRKHTLNSWTFQLLQRDRDRTSQIAILGNVPSWHVWRTGKATWKNVGSVDIWCYMKLRVHSRSCRGVVSYKMLLSHIKALHL